MRRRPADPPRAPQLPARLEPADPRELAHDAAHSGIAVADAALLDQRARGVSLEALTLTRVDASGSRLDHLRISDAVLVACNLANVQARSGELRRASVATSRLTGIAMTNGILCDVAVSDCRVDLASFTGAGLTRVTFEDCVLSGTDFMEARLDSVRFHGCDLRQADFRGAQLQRCEFRRSDLTAIEGIGSLRGAALELSAIVALADVWAAALGVAVLDD